MQDQELDPIVEKIYNTIQEKLQSSEEQVITDTSEINYNNNYLFDAAEMLRNNGYKANVCLLNNNRFGIVVKKSTQVSG